MAVPKVVAFDLDATLWFPEMYQVWQSDPIAMHCVF